VKLPTGVDDYRTFEFYLEFLHNGASFTTNRTSLSDVEFPFLCDMYRLGVAIDDADFQNAILRRVLHFHTEVSIDGRAWPPSDKLLARAYNVTQDGCALRRLLVDMYLTTYTDVLHFDGTLGFEFPSEFLVQLATARIQACVGHGEDWKVWMVVAGMLQDYDICQMVAEHPTVLRASDYYQDADGTFCPAGVLGKRKRSTEQNQDVVPFKRYPSSEAPFYAQNARATFDDSELMMS